MTSQLLSSILASTKSPTYYQKPILPTAQPRAFLPQFDPQGFMNSPQMAGFTSAPQVQAQVAAPAALAPVAQPQNNNNFGDFIKALTAPHGHHFGIGGAEISPDNPFGNPGGDPFKNGMLQHTPQDPNMRFLGGSPRMTPGQMQLVNWSNQVHAQPQAGVNLMPPQGAAPTIGSPVWQQQNPNFNPFSDANWGQVPGTTAQSNLKNKQAFWAAMGM